MGTFTFAGDEGLAKYEWPYIAIAGIVAGPTVLITAGIHAAEYTGIEAAIRLGQQIRPDSVRGTVIIIPLLNRPGFYERSIYVNPEDGDNLNRLFPGKADGTWGERFAHRLLSEIVSKCDCAIDLHAGDLVEDLVPFVIYRETGDAARDATIVRMANAYGAAWAVKSAPTGERPGSLYAVAALSGVAAILAESGGRGPRRDRGRRDPAGPRADRRRAHPRGGFPGRSGRRRRTSRVRRRDDPARSHRLPRPSR